MSQAVRNVGRYEILAELGRGSMGVVYKAHDPTIGRTVAIKMLLSEKVSAGDYREYIERFRREAKAAGALAHPNIVTIYDFAEDNGMAYLAMEFLEGQSLEKLVTERGVLPVETIIPIFEQVCSALDAAHAAGIIHRDVKPANIMILDSGRVKVTDFGIAKIMSSQMTQAGQILGTPNYMSPEQVLNRPLDGRSDIFSLGAILYELVTGERPFGGQNVTTVIYRIVHDMPIPPRELDPGIHPGLNYVVSKALAKSPEERYQTCGELAEDLKNYKNIAGVVAAGATVVMTAPAFAPVPAGEANAPAARLAGVQATQATAAPGVAAEAKRAKGGIPAAVWAMCAVIVVASLAAYYFLFFKITTTPNHQVPPATSTPNPSGSAGTGAGAGAAPKAAETGPKARPEAGVSPKREAPPKTGPTGGEASGRTGEVSIEVTPADSEVYIDGRDLGTSPVNETVAVGRHTLTVQRNGYETKTEKFSLRTGEAFERKIKLEPKAGAAGMVSVRTIPGGAKVLADDTVAGTPTPTSFSLTAGPHTLTLLLRGCPPIRVDIEVTAGGTSEVKQAFKCP